MQCPTKEQSWKINVVLILRLNFDTTTHSISLCTRSDILKHSMSTISMMSPNCINSKKANDHLRSIGFTIPL